MNSRLSYFDSLRGIAILGVVLIHCISFSNENVFSASVLIRQAVNFSVPLFIAISGYFIADKKIESWKVYVQFLKKQIPRVYVPYLVWSIIFIIYFFFTGKNLSIIEIIQRLIYFQTTPIFYFVALVLQYYVLAPLLLKNVTKFKLCITAAISISMVLVINYYFHQKISLLVYGGNALTWIVFFYLGIYIKKQGFKISEIYLALLCVLFYFISLLETQYLNMDGIALSKAVTSVKISNFFYSFFIIAFFLGKQREWKIFSDLGKVSYGIFLSHLLFISITSKIIKFFNGNNEILILQLLKFVIVCILSYVLCKLLQKLSPKVAYKYFGI